VISSVDSHTITWGQVCPVVKFFISWTSCRGLDSDRCLYSTL